jgi:hypothetical protein
MNSAQMYDIIESPNTIKYNIKYAFYFLFVV